MMQGRESCCVVRMQKRMRMQREHSVPRQSLRWVAPPPRCGLPAGLTLGSSALRVGALYETAVSAEPAALVSSGEIKHCQFWCSGGECCLWFQPAACLSLVAFLRVAFWWSSCHTQDFPCTQDADVS